MEKGVVPSLVRGHKKWIVDKIRQPVIGSDNQTMLSAVFRDICLLNMESGEGGETLFHQSSKKCDFPSIHLNVSSVSVF